MRRFLSTSLILLAIFVSAAGAAPAAHAQEGGTAQETAAIDTQITANANADPYGGDTAAAAQDLNTAARSSTNPATTANAAAASIPTPPTLGGDASSQFGWIMQFIMTLFAWLVGVAAITLDNAVFYTVVKMGSYVKDLAAVGVTWRILRDVGNIMLIFGFLSVGITTILNVEWYGVSKKMLPMMLVAAVFLNFSLFISEAMVDTGNLFATQFYQQINGGMPAGAKNYDFPSFTRNGIVVNDGIANKIMAQLGLQSIYGDAMRNKQVFQGGYTWIIGFMGIILFIVTAFVLFSLAFILIARFVALVFLIIASPLGFAALAMPGFANIQKKWWTAMFEQSITAPILLLMLYIALAVITDVQFLTGFGIGGGPTAAQGFWTGFVTNVTGATNLTGFGSMILSFLVAMGLLLAVVVYAKRWSAFGGDWASRMGARLSFGATSWAARQTVGRGLQVASKRFNASRLSRIPGAGRAVSGVLGYGAKGSFDVRGTGVLKAIPFGSQIDAGKAQEGGFRTMQKETKEAKKAYDAESRIGRLKVAIKATNIPETNKIMRTLTDEDIQTPDMLDLIKTDPFAVQALTGHQASILPDAVIKNSSVYSNLSPSQLESIRTGGNMSAATARTIGLAALRAANPVFDTWVHGRNASQLADLVAFWG